MSQQLRHSRRSAVIAGTFVALALIAYVAAVRAAPANDAVVKIDNFTFTPAQIRVSPGTKVTWINDDDIPHLIIDSTDPQAMKSQPLDTDNQFSFVYKKAGVFPYFCGL